MRFIRDLENINNVLIDKPLYINNLDGLKAVEICTESNPNNFPI